MTDPAPPDAPLGRTLATDSRDPDLPTQASPVVVAETLEPPAVGGQDDDIWAATTAAPPPVDPAELDDAADADATLALSADPEPEPWGPRRWFEVLTSWVIVALVTVFTLAQLQPGDILSSAVPTGGDMGAHVWAPAYLRDHLLPHWRLSGWSMDWYSGLPVYRFYMIPPALAILALDTVLPYGMAMKIVSVLGCITLPICLYAFGKLARLPYPIPAMLAVAGGVFLFDETFTILGGNIASTMAGEFSFSIALSLSVLAIGVFARGLETGRYRALSAVLIALAILTHGLVALFVMFGAALMWVLWLDGRRFIYGLTTGLTALALSAFWLMPFIGTSKFMTDMKYEGAPTVGSEWNNYWKMFFPHSSDADRFWVVLALVGFIAGVVRRQRIVAWMGVYSLLLIATVFFAKEGIPGFGLLWNVRLLPFIYLLRYMLAMVGIAEIVWGLMRWKRDRRIAQRVVEVGSELPAGAVMVGHLNPTRVSARKFYASIATLGLVGAVGIGWLSWHLGKFPGQSEKYYGEGKSEQEKWRFEWGFGSFKLDIATSKNNGFVDGWARHNYTGYEGKSAYGEYRALVDTMKSLGADPAHGCGRAMWEHTDGAYGTPMALMLLPFWTDSCIGSSEGLYFEASATTPYHFLASAALSESASNPVRGLTYEKKNAEIGVRYLQTLGMRYYMAYTPEAIERATEQPELIEVARSGPWRIYEVAGSDLVRPLTIEPVVVNGREGDQREMWLEVGASWFQHPEKWAAIPAADGPTSWQRVDVTSDDPKPYPTVDLVRPKQPVQTRNLEPVVVSDVRMGDESISFRVDKPGVPVLVRTSWFPNWEADGASGPYRVAPNMMVVIPRSTEVRLVYGTSNLDYLAWFVTFAGLLGLVWLWRSGRMALSPDFAGPAYPTDPDPFGPDLDPVGASMPWADDERGDGGGVVDEPGLELLDDDWLERAAPPLPPQTSAGSKSDPLLPPPPGYGVASHE